MRALALLAALLLLPLAHAALPTGAAVLARGTARHTYVTDATCEADADFALTFEVATHRVTVVSDTPCVPGYYSQVLGCKGGAGQDVVCHREQGVAVIDVLLTTAGGFEFRWVEPTFDERIVGELDRTDL